jgi:hypothetical protein
LQLKILTIRLHTTSQMRPGASRLKQPIGCSYRVGRKPSKHL